MQSIIDREIVYAQNSKLGDLTFGDLDGRRFRDASSIGKETALSLRWPLAPLAEGRREDRNFEPEKHRKAGLKNS